MYFKFLRKYVYLYCDDSEKLLPLLNIGTGKHKWTGCGRCEQTMKILSECTKVIKETSLAGGNNKGNVSQNTVGNV